MADYSDVFTGIPARYPGVEYSLLPARQHVPKFHKALLPDEPCWFLGLADLGLKVIFEYSARKMGSHVSDEMTSASDPDVVPYLLAAHDFSWVLHLAPKVSASTW